MKSRQCTLQVDSFRVNERMRENPGNRVVHCDAVDDVTSIISDP